MNPKVSQFSIPMKVDLHMNPLVHMVIQRKEQGVLTCSIGEQMGATQIYS